MAAGLVYHNITTASGVTFTVASWVPDTAAPDVSALPVHVPVGSDGVPLSAAPTGTSEPSSGASGMVTRLARNLNSEFDLTLTPTVTNGAYSAGDIVGALLTFAVASENAQPVMIDGIQITLKAAVQPNLRIVLLNADPTSTTKTDNAAYSINAADAYKIVRTINLGGAYNTHGTPKEISIDNLGMAYVPGASDTNLYALVVDDTGVTLTSTSDMQVRVRGRRIG